MQLPHPLTRLADCCWLPRHIAKTRVYLRGEMPFAYRIALGSRVGVDGYFFRHFKLSRAQIVAAVRGAPADEQIATWFLARRGVTPELIAQWNEFAPLIGAKGHPGYLTRHTVKWIFYPKSITRPVGSLFEAIIQDEGLSS